VPNKEENDMDKSLLVGTVLGAVVVTAGGAIAGYNMMNKEPTFAEVVAVKPVTETIKTPRQVCHDEAVTRTAPVKDRHRIAGTAVGAALGGLVGNQFGGGTANKAITAAGVIGGGYAGNKVQQKMQQGNTYTTTETRCETVTDSRQNTIGYDVTYVLDGQQATVRMDHEPGNRIPVENGQLVLTDDISPGPQSDRR
jgi:uncharacterized protein YcfJ